ncbi:hypothetical protein RZO07_14675 [Pseudomonas protegens]|uniref:Uncharacterized protein n=1 Tax=Pseudomonas abietaniphila TaxID=89065 RepID=A0A1G7U481_9PSED|nr:MULTISPECIES: hypothetical protein [Pseudomonas]WOE82408.1 hypothetical protein RZO07_14675 [Pseudomonas protegens]SDG42188.1 hypothetical protein SAMN05216605_10242 [Pseudomonas abietaniphila]
MANNIAVKLTIGIPSEIVYYLTYAYNGGTKCSPSVTLDLDQAGPTSLKVPALAWGTTREYDSDDVLAASAGKPAWFRSLRPGAQPIGTATLARTTDNLNAVWTPFDGASHAVKFIIDGGNPLAVAPHIDATIIVGLRKAAGDVQFSVDGIHDGFPNYTLQINGKTVYEWDAVKQGEDPSALGGTGDQSIKIAWKTL